MGELVNIIEDIERTIQQAYYDAIDEAATYINAELNAISSNAADIYYAGYTPNIYKRQMQLKQGFNNFVEVIKEGWDAYIPDADQDGFGYANLPYGASTVNILDQWGAPDSNGHSNGWKAYAHAWSSGKPRRLTSSKYGDSYMRGEGCLYPEWLEKFIGQNFLNGEHIVSFDRATMTPGLSRQNNPEIKSWIDEQLSILEKKAQKKYEEALNKLL